MTHDCELIQSAILEGVDHADAVAACPTCRAFAQDWAELREDIGRYRDTVLSEIRPSEEARRRTQRMLVKLVEEDVRERHRRSTSVRAISMSWLTRLRENWQDLFATSRLFRFGTHGAMAFGCGLIVTMALDVVSVLDSAPAGAADMTPARSPLSVEAPIDPGVDEVVEPDDEKKKGK